MKRDRIAGDDVIEVSDRDLGDRDVIACIARDAKVGSLVYAPLEERPAVQRRTGQHVEPLDPESREPTKPSKPDPRRVDGLRAALRARGRDLESLGCFYWQVTKRAAASRSSRPARCAP